MKLQDQLTYRANTQETPMVSRWSFKRPLCTHSDSFLQLESERQPWAGTTSGTLHPNWPVMETSGRGGGPNKDCTGLFPSRMYGGFGSGPLSRGSCPVAHLRIIGTTHKVKSPALTKTTKNYPHTPDFHLITLRPGHFSGWPGPFVVRFDLRYRTCVFRAGPSSADAAGGFLALWKWEES